MQQTPNLHMLNESSSKEVLDEIQLQKQRCQNAILPLNRK
jgi:hypothetical protein